MDALTGSTALVAAVVVALLVLGLLVRSAYKIADPSQA
jgi:hypothetical protein